MPNLWHTREEILKDKLSEEIGSWGDGVNKRMKILLISSILDPLMPNVYRHDKVLPPSRFRSQTV
jgi:hypothetical protein